MLERSGFIGVRVFGHLGDPDLTEIREFFDKNKVPHTWVDVDAPDGRAAMATLDGLREEIGFDDVLYDDRIGKVSVVGVGMRSHPGVTAKFFSALAEVGVNIEMISTSEIRISVVVDQDDVDRAVAAAHTAIGLDAADEAVVYAGTGR